MKIDEKKVIDKIINLAKSVIDGDDGATQEVRLNKAISNCSQIITICELLEFETPAQPIQTIRVEPYKTGDTERIFQTPAEVTSMFQEAVREQKEAPRIPEGPKVRHE